jgi:hypothetical protein
MERAGGVGQHDGAASGGGRRAHAVGDDGRVVALVEVDATEEHEHTASGELDRAHRRPMTGGRRWREAGEVGEGDVDPAAQLRGGAAPSRSEDDGDVVAAAASARGQLGRRGGGEGERLGGHGAPAYG